jgi:hypothetical protein
VIVSNVVSYAIVLTTPCGASVTYLEQPAKQPEWAALSDCGTYRLLLNKAALGQGAD